MFESLPLTQRDTILGIKTTAKTSEKVSLDTKPNMDDICTAQSNPDENTPATSGKQRENKPIEDIQDNVSSGRPSIAQLVIALTYYDMLGRGSRGKQGVKQI